MMPITKELDILQVKKAVLLMFFHSYTKMEIDFYDPLPFEKSLTLCNVIIVITINF